MEIIKKGILLMLLIATIFSCKTIEKNKNLSKTSNTSKAILEKLKSDGFKTFDYVDEKTKDTVIMQQYFIAFLKKGDNRSPQNKEESESLQKAHRAHLGKMYDLGFADISGPIGNDGDIRGVTIYNVPNIKLADSLANSDPMVKAGRLKIEIHPWWAGKGYKLR